ncbi:hypothetical protein ASPVEDRAFT_140153 [Aspergillus versicolor CBS 583.65]|uniref:Condensation domain-containing protein n=1 Tax=Aspergillus versicolor CBS 583.65 TaxID=1036611 RepID=A0A1L9PY36_ASPVE|nr:uncharacterized protein ASPVEDRAFT_140153 [Aspergillus versicolor CBS 583.65]OJJ06459.1 hypothetical protein ASPVEDRAFT_140153 [Aspergillus versicolor CBS 583.65]
MTWSKIESGHFQRPIGENERFIKAVGDRAHSEGREHWSITSYASFRLDETTSKAPGEVVQLLRQAWKRLRFRHPSIASTANDDTLDYLVPTPEELEDWVDDTFTIVQNVQLSVNDVIASLRPSRYVTGHYLVHASQFIIHLAHWRTDGYGAFQLLGAFFEAAVADEKPEYLPWGLETDRLVPTVEEALKNPVDSSPEIHAAAKKYLSTVTLTKGAVGVALQTDLSRAPSGTRSARLRFSRENTDAITQACESNGISILSAVHASTAAATYHFANAESKTKPYTSTMRFSIRPYLPTPYDNAAVAAGIYTGGYMFQVSPSQSWIENARQYHHEYEIGISNDFLSSRRQYARDVLAMMKAAPPPSATPPSEIDISFADAETHVSEIYKGPQRKIEVTEVSVGVETLTRQMYCFVWIFRGCLELSAVYNEAFYTESFVQDVVRVVATVLRRELGLSSN